MKLPHIHTSRCTGCGWCVAACPPGVLSLQVVAWRKTKTAALSVSRPLERDRGVDETGGQVAVFGRIGSRPLNLEEQRKMFLKPNGNPWTVVDNPPQTGQQP